MTTKIQNPKKRKKIIWLFVFLIVIIVAVTLIIYIKINGSLLNKKAQDIINRYKETIIESVQIPGITESDKKIQENNQDAKKILELQNIIKELQKRIDNSSSSTSNIEFVVASSLLVNKLQTDDPFLKELNILMQIPIKYTLKNKLEVIIPYAKTGIKTEEDLMNDYQKVYQETYSSYLASQSSFGSKIKSYLLYLVFVKKTQTKLLTDNKIESKLANVETLMKQNNFKKAYVEFMSINVDYSNNTKRWISEMFERIEANEIIKEINSELNNYLELGSK